MLLLRHSKTLFLLFKRLFMQINIENIWFGIALVFVLSMVLSYFVNLFFLRYSGSLFSKKLPENAVRFSTQRKPAIGGVSFYVSFIFGIMAFLLFFPYERDGLNTLEISAIIGTVSLGFILGLYDDLRNSPVIAKFIIQFLIAFILIFAGVYIQLFENDYLNYALTVFWVVGIMNSINMLDNMDAITSVTSISIIFTVLLYLFFKAEVNSIDFVIMVAVFGSLLGFLRFNWHPSKMYMGDVGSQFLGVLLAIIGIKYFWNFADGNDALVNTKQIIVIAMAYVLPLSDTTTVFYKRIARGQSPFIGGRDHTTHHLSYIGLSVRKIALLFLGIGLLSSIFTITILLFIEEWSYLYFILFLCYVLAIFVSLFYIANIHKEEDTKR